MGKSDSIRVSQKYGLNPALMSCPWCGKDSGEIALLGDTRQYQCRICQGFVYGHGVKACPHCKASGSLKDLGEFEATSSTRFPGGLCDACKAKKKAVDEEVRAGGIHWRCLDCKSAGAIKAGHPLSLDVRAHLKLDPPAPCGIEFSKKDCPVCGPHAIAQGD